MEKMRWKKDMPMKNGISQEGLKLVACITMLIDHIGYKIIYPLYARSAVVFQPGKLHSLYLLCRSIGRIAFPIFVFLLVEGFYHTRSRKRYALRLAVGALLAEIPYNLMVSGQMFWQQQSVMVTLLLGFGAVACMDKCPSLSWKPVVMLPFALAAELLMADYGWAGVLLAALFALSRGTVGQNFFRFVGMVVLFHYTSSYVFQIGGFSVPMQVLGALSMIFIAGYDGRKITGNKAVQWGFYLFYPVHMLFLWAVGKWIMG